MSDGNCTCSLASGGSPFGGRNGGLVVISPQYAVTVLHPRASEKGARVQIEGTAKNKMWNSAEIVTAGVIGSFELTQMVIFSLYLLS